ncbi:MAG: hypothetical protein GY941_15065 [Planctomycetes bacterium]|nr:hypothetical protein [Planctomycetota bacterium]
MINAEDKNWAFCCLCSVDDEIKKRPNSTVTMQSPVCVKNYGLPCTNEVIANIRRLAQRGKKEKLWNNFCTELSAKTTDAVDPTDYPALSSRRYEEQCLTNRHSSPSLLRHRKKLTSRDDWYIPAENRSQSETEAHSDNSDMTNSDNKRQKKGKGLGRSSDKGISKAKAKKKSSDKGRSKARSRSKTKKNAHNHNLRPRDNRRRTVDDSEMELSDNMHSSLSSSGSQNNDSDRSDSSSEEESEDKLQPIKLNMELEENKWIENQAPQRSGEDN